MCTSVHGEVVCVLVYIHLRIYACTYVCTSLTTNTVNIVLTFCVQIIMF